MTDLRCEIEAIALRRSVERGDVEWEARVMAAGHRLRSQPRPRPGRSPELSAWLASHADYHAALISACGSPWHETLHAQLYEQSERYRILSAYSDSERDVVDEHQQIIDLALARDVEGLVSATVHHIRHTTDVIVRPQ